VSVARALAVVEEQVSLTKNGDPQRVAVLFSLPRAFDRLTCHLPPAT
jgi:hypothetical protein